MVYKAFSFFFFWQEVDKITRDKEYRTKSLNHTSETKKSVFSISYFQKCFYNLHAVSTYCKPQSSWTKFPYTLRALGTRWLHLPSFKTANNSPRGLEQKDDSCDNERITRMHIIQLIYQIYWLQDPWVVILFCLLFYNSPALKREQPMRAKPTRDSFKDLHSGKLSQNLRMSVSVYDVTMKMSNCWWNI